MFALSVPIHPYGGIPRAVAFFSLAISVRLLNGEPCDVDIQTVAEPQSLAPGVVS